MDVVILEAGGAPLGLPASAVRGVEATRPVMPLPFTPPFVDGLVGVGGGIAPQVGLARRLWPGAERPVPAEEALVLLETPGGSTALRVDRAVQLVRVAAEDVDAFEGGDGVDAGLVAGRFPWRGRTALLLRPDRLGLPGAAFPAEVGDGLAAFADEAEAAGAPEREETVFVIAQGESLFAFPILETAEALEAPPASPMPQAPAEVEGMTLLRGRPLMVVDLGRVLGNDGAAARHGPLLVMAHPAGRFAFRVERIVGIRRFAASRLHRGEEAGPGFDHAVDGDGRAVGLLAVERLVDAGRLERLGRLLPRAEEDVRAAEEPQRTLLTFRVGEERCALPLEPVERIAEFQGMTAVPGDDGANPVDGLTEVGGEILPAADLRRRLGAPVRAPVRAPMRDEAAVIVARAAGGRWALVVDRAERLVRLPVSALHGADAGAGRLVMEVGVMEVGVMEVGHMDGRILCVLDPAALIQGRTGP